MDRDCNRCIHHISVACSSWDCEMMTLEDYRTKVIEEFVEKVVAELDSIEDCVCNALKCESCKHYSSCYDSGVAERTLINKAINIVRNAGKEGAE